MTDKLKNISTLPPEGTLKSVYKKEINALKKRLDALQEKLFAENKQSLLLILQGMDASGKDNAVKHVFSGINPAGCRVKSFKVPSEEEDAHHFLWRISKECPERRYIQIFNRSHYEHVLENVVNQQMDSGAVDECLAEIDAFEKGLQQNGTIVLKFYLHVSQKVQEERLEVRKNDPDKQWKYQKEDQKSIARHNDYQVIYDEILSRKQTIAWQVIPSDKKWYKNYLILKSVVETLEKYIQP